MSTQVEQTVEQTVLTQPQTQTEIVISNAHEIMAGFNLPYASPEILQKAQEAASKVNLEDSNEVMWYAYYTQNAYLQKLKILSSEISVEDLDKFGDYALMLMNGIEVVELQKIDNELKNRPWYVLLKGVPKIGDWIYRKFSALHHFSARKQSFINLITQVEKEALNEQKFIMSDNSRLEAIYKEMEQNYRDLEFDILVGRIAYNNWVEKYKVIFAEAQSKNDLIELQKANMIVENLAMLDHRLVALQSNYVRAPMTAQEILNNMQSGRISAQNIISTLMTHLPNLLTAINNLAALARQDEARKKASSMHDMARKASEMASQKSSQAYIATQKSLAYSSEEIDALQFMLTTITDTLKQGVEIKKANREVNKQAVKKLVQIQKEFEQSMKQVGELSQI